MKKIMYPLLVCVFIMALSTSSLTAGGFKKYAGAFTDIGVGGRGTSLGGAYSALVNDVSAIYWNPAGLIEAKGFQMQFMHSKQFISSIQNNFIAFSHPYSSKASIGLSLNYLTVNNIQNSIEAGIFDVGTQELIGIDESKIKRFNTGDYIVQAAYAQRYNDVLNWGGTVKLIYRDFGSATASGLGFDAGAKYKTENFSAGLVIKDVVGTMMTWSTNETQFITPSVRLGAAYIYKGIAKDLTLTPVAELIFRAENRNKSSQLHLDPFSVDAALGLEIDYNQVLDVRVGVDELQRLNAGIGLNLQKISIDYAFTAFENELGNIHRISFNLHLPTIL